MMPTEVRASIAEFISSTNSLAIGPDTDAVILSSIVLSHPGRRDSRYPTEAKPTISNGNNAKIV